MVALHEEIDALFVEAECDFHASTAIKVSGKSQEEQIRKLPHFENQTSHCVSNTHLKTGFLIAKLQAGINKEDVTMAWQVKQKIQAVVAKSMHRRFNDSTQHFNHPFCSEDENIGR